MYLKRIEIQGFKSFANKTVLDFKPGITGIVGPNGSGKSNVADAVRWVLGEMSPKSLRGSNMQDVIFAGTEVKKPQGFAAVTLVLDNSDRLLSKDFEELSVTRKTFRSGESEYRLNGAPCRLKDIVELFYDTGVGREGYSIIGQGQVERILNAKPEERRELFDEAAGIVKQRKRKDASIKKLEDEQNSIVRVKDIISELERQLAPLRAQAETAKKYLALRDELKAGEVGAFFRESEDVTGKLAASDEKIEILQADIIQSRELFEKQRSDYDEISEERSRLDSVINENQEELNTVSVRKQQLEGQIELLTEQVNALKRGADETKQRIITLDGEIKGRLAERQRLVTEKGKLDISADESDDRISEAESAVSETEDRIRILEYQLEKAHGELYSNATERERLAADEQRIRSIVEQTGERLAELAREVEKNLQLAAEKEKEAAEKKAELASLNDEINGAEEELSKARNGLLSLEEKRDDAQKKLSETFSRYQAAHSRLETLNGIAERYEGYGESIRRVMDRKYAVKGIHGVVADIIKVDREYELAIETALGGKIQNVVVSDESTAKELIEYLKKNRAGRVTFLPMDAVEGREGFRKEAALDEKGAIGIASELVSCEPRYRGIVEHLLGRILVSDTMDNALRIAGKYGHGLHIVTLEGEYLSPGGSITGGAFRNNANLLSRGRQIDELKSETGRLEAEGDELKKLLSAADGEVTEQKQRIDRCSSAVYSLKISLTELSASCEQTEAEYKKAQAAAEACDLQREELSARAGELENRMRAASVQAEQARAKDEERKAENESIQRELDELKAGKDEAAAALSVLKQNYSSLIARSDFLMQDIRRLSQEAEKLRLEKDELVRNGDPDGIRISEKLENIETSRAELADVEDELKQLGQKLKAAKTRRENYEKRQKEALNERDSSSERVTSLEKELYRLNSQRERLQEAYDALVQNIWDEYGLTPAEAEQLKTDSKQSLAELRRGIKRTREEIKALGPVNVNAIEDERQTSERYEFMSGQYADLLKARDSLLEIIDELDAGMRRQFDQSFKKIRVEFNSVFRELFGGGTADLQILKEEGQDLLDCGVSVIAQPPGKKLQNMLQLSGGEKALTAIALIFAIQNLKPSPFCLVDEIEAALDENNVDRFAAYIKKVQNNTQMIAITHRRGTMQVAERLYGITMQEKGVSTLVSVDLNDPQYK